MCADAAVQKRFDVYASETWCGRLQERASGMYRLSAIYFARSAADLPLDFAIPTVFILIVYLMGHLRYTAAAFFANYFTVLLLALVRGVWKAQHCHYLSAM